MDPIILISVAVILIVGISLLLFLDRRPRLPAGTYPTTRDPNDPAGGGSTAVLDRPEADQTVVGDVAAADSGLIDEDRVDAGTAVAEPEAPAEARPAPPPAPRPRPIVPGLQSAIVVGQSSEEIETDAYGRIKIRFLWDRHWPKDEKACEIWVRVAQPYAGKWGGTFFLPRIGDEV
ncbi:phage baseplate assembly protein V, partial [Citricoccus sp.]|uniref:phage baseplate assembly protein V n=1 Tax=Citricoccus sp. TaxID=1978372 RepID=UPI002BB19836